MEESGHDEEADRQDKGGAAEPDLRDLIHPGHFKILPRLPTHPQESAVPRISALELAGSLCPSACRLDSLS